VVVRPDGVGRLEVAARPLLSPARRSSKRSALTPTSATAWDVGLTAPPLRANMIWIA
jgi:hypothetical protein